MSKFKHGDRVKIIYDNDTLKAFSALKRRGLNDNNYHNKTGVILKYYEYNIERECDAETARLVQDLNFHIGFVYDVKIDNSNDILWFKEENLIQDNNWDEEKL